MGNLVKDFLNSKHTKDVVAVIIGRMASAGFGFLAIIIIAKELGPKGFGLFYLFTVVMMLISELAAGSVNQALVRFASSYLRQNRARAELVLKVTLKIQIVIALILLVASYFLSAPLSRIIFGKQGFEHFIRLAFIGSIGLNFVKYLLAVLQSHQTFVKYSFLEAANNLLKLVIIASLRIANALTTVGSVVVYVATSYLSVMCGLVLIPKTFLHIGASQRSLLPELIHFSKWVMLSYVLYTIYSRMDTILLGHYKGSEAVAIYAAALVMAFFFEVLAIAIFTVVLPQVSRFSTRAKYARFVKRFLAVAIPSGFLMCAALSLAARPLILTFYTHEFTDSIRILRVLLLNSTVVLIALPISSVLLSLNKPQVLAGIDFLVLIVMLCASFLLIPSYGPIGAAIAVLTSRILYGVLVITKSIVEIEKITV